MKVVCLLLFLSALRWTDIYYKRYHATSQTRNKSAITKDTGRLNLNIITKEDREHYELTIKLGKLTVDSCPKPDTFYSINATLKNKSKDTLKYIELTCSHDIWSSDDPMIWAGQLPMSCGGCDNNSLKEFMVPPHQSKSIQLATYYIRGVKHTPTTLRIGMVLQRVMKRTDWYYYLEYPLVNGYFFDLHDQVQNRIWSNSIGIH